MLLELFLKQLEQGIPNLYKMEWLILKSIIFSDF